MQGAELPENLTEELLREAFDALPLQVFIIDEELQVLGANTQAAKAYGWVRSQKKAQCFYGRGHTYGESQVCKRCDLIPLIREVFRTQKGVQRLLRKHQRGIREERRLLARIKPLAGGKHALLLLEDPSELFPHEAMIPICCSCKSIRDESNHWSPLEKYLCDNLVLKFSHGICPTCRENFTKQQSIP